MNKNYFFLLGLLTFLLVNTYNSFGWLSGASYRRAIIINNVLQNTTNYALPINVSYESGMNFNFSNVVFTDINNNIRASWVEVKNDSSWALFWVNISIFNGTIGYVYWGSELNNENNCEKVFLFCDEFSYNNTLTSSGRWANNTFLFSKAFGYYGNFTNTLDNYGQKILAYTNNNYEITNGDTYLVVWAFFGKDYFPDYNPISGSGAGFFRDTSNYYILSASTYNSKNKAVNNYKYSGSFGNYYWNGDICDGVFNGFGYFRDLAIVQYSGGSLIVNRTFFNYNGTSCKINHTMTWSNVPLYFGFVSWGGPNIFVDYVFLTKTLINQPTINLGSLETTPSVMISLWEPQFNSVFNQNFFETNNSINFSFNITSNFNLENCYLTLNNNSILIYTSPIPNGTLNYSLFLNFGIYYWNISCSVNNTNYSRTTYYFRINKKPIISSITYKPIQRNPVIINYSIIDYDSPTITCSLFLNNNNITTNTTNNNTLTQFYFNTNSLESHINITCSDGYATTSNQTLNEIIINNALFTLRVLDEQNQTFLTNTSYNPFSLPGSDTLTSIIIPKKPIVLYSTWGDPCTYNLWEDGVLVKSGGWAGSNCSVIINYTLKPNKTYVLNRTNSNYLFEHINVNNTLLEATSINYACPFTIQNTINFKNYSNSAVENYSYYKVDYADGFLINITDNNLNNLIVDLYNYNYTPNITNFNNETIIINTPLWLTSLNIQNNSVGLLSIPYSLNIPNYYGQKFNITYQEPHSNGYLCRECDVINNYLTLTNYKYLRNIIVNVKNNYYDDTNTYQITNYHSNNTLMFYDENTKNLLDLTASNPNTLILVCEENTTNHNITNQQYNLTINCNKPQLLFYQTYGTTTYYRSLVPEASTTNPRILNFTMINLNTTNAIVLTIVFFGLQQNDIIRIYDGTTLLTEQTPDLSGSISFIAIQYHSYTIHLIRSGTTRVLGTLIADYSGTKYVNINPFTFGSSSTTINDYITFTTERTNTYAKITYNDLLNQTNIAYCNFTDKNKNLQMESIVYYSNNITFTYNNNTNATLIANCLINHNTFGIITKSFLFVGNTTEENPTALRMEWLDEGTKKWFALAIIITLVVLTAVFVKISLLLLSGSLLFFNYFGWLTIPTPILAIIIVFSIMYVLLKKESW